MGITRKMTVPFTPSLRGPILLAIFSFVLSISWSQTTNSTQISPAKKRSTSAQKPQSSVRPNSGGQPSKEDFMFSFDKVPTFEDHDRIAAMKENNLPIKFPVLPIYNVSEELPGYVDLLRRVSIMTFEGIVDELDETYTKPWDMVIDLSGTMEVEAELNENLKFRSQEIIQSNAGDEFLVDKFEYFSDDEWWDRTVMSIAAEVPDGVRYIQVVIHYPREFRELCTNELNYYFSEAIINPYKR